MSEETIGPITAAYDLYVDLTRRDATIATLTAALVEARGALEAFVAKMQKVEDQYRKRGGNPDAFPDTHPSFDISADSRELPLGAWRRARTALATIKAALGRVER